ncbi:MAG TPA: hypothetical protein VHG09_05520 [Longimicrobiales bacterium]|nr:hypothetical protein [Longimicrobiales bacterium]
MSAPLAEQIADTVLYEGYVLYPYRASAAKNRLRWQVGLVTPRDYSEATGSDPWFTQTEILVNTDDVAALTVRVRCLHVQQRIVQQQVEADHAARDGWQTVDSLNVDGRQLVTWEEAVVCDFVRERLPVDRMQRAWSFEWVLNGSDTVETISDGSERPAGRILRRRNEVVSMIRVETEPCEHLVKVRVRVENVSLSELSSLDQRNAAIQQSLAGTHAILSVDNGVFLSLLEPPASARTAAASCVNLHTWPVLVGSSDSTAVMLSSPIILYDYPQVAPESPGDFCDATEIDEMLMLRIQTLTAEEKREARATDERAARIIDRADAASAETMNRLHGAVRHFANASSPPSGESWETFLNPPDAPAPDAAWLDIGPIRIGNGSRVRLRPTHRADSMDMCLAGRTATVAAVHRTLEDKPFVAVILDDDPFGAAGSRYRRALFFHPDEIVPLDADGRDDR